MPQQHKGQQDGRGGENNIINDGSSSSSSRVEAAAALRILVPQFGDTVSGLKDQVETWRRQAEAQAAASEDKIQVLLKVNRELARANSALKTDALALKSERNLARQELQLARAAAALSRGAIRSSPAASSRGSSGSSSGRSVIELRASSTVFPSAENINDDEEVVTSAAAAEARSFLMPTNPQALRLARGGADEQHKASSAIPTPSQETLSLSDETSCSSSSSESSAKTPPRQPPAGAANNDEESQSNGALPSLEGAPGTTATPPAASLPWCQSSSGSAAPSRGPSLLLRIPRPRSITANSPEAASAAAAPPCTDSDKDGGQEPSADQETPLRRSSRSNKPQGSLAEPGLRPKLRKGDPFTFGDQQHQGSGGSSEAPPASRGRGRGHRGRGRKGGGGSSSSSSSVIWP